jgi:hypothetical protein
MKDSTISRWLWLVGLVAAASLFVGFGPLTGNVPGENASGVAVAHWFNARPNQDWASIYVVGFGLALLLVYVTQLRSVLAGSGDQKLWPNVTFASIIVLVTGLIVAGAFHVTLILAAHNHQYATVKMLNFEDQNNELLFLAGLSFLMLATGLSILLNRNVAPLPRSLGWYSLLVGVVSVLGPLSFFGLLFGLPIWLVAVGIVIAVKTRRGELDPAPGSAAPRTADAPRAAPVAV